MKPITQWLSIALKILIIQNLGGCRLFKISLSLLDILYSTLTNHFKFMKLSFLSSHTHNGCFFTELYSTSRNLLAKMVWFSKCKVPRSWYFGSCRFLPRLDAYLDLSQITFSFPKLGKQSLATKNLLVDIPAALSNARESLSFLFDVLQEG